MQQITLDPIYKVSIAYSDSSYKFEGSPGILFPTFTNFHHFSILCVNRKQRKEK